MLGSHLLYRLLSDGKEVTAIRRTARNLPEVRKVFSYYTEKPGEMLDRVHWVEADILNYQEMLDVMEGMDEVYHCAAIVSFDPAKRREMIHCNRQGTANVVNAALQKQVRKLVHVSSTAAVGTAPEGQLADETMIWSESKTSTGYSVSKFHSEMEVWRAIQEGLNAAIVNPSIILGPGFWQHGSSSIFTKVDHGLKFYTTGVTGYVGVWDVIDAMVMLMESDISRERFLVTSENLTYQEVFSKVADALGKKRPHIEARVFLSEVAWRADWMKSKLLGFGEHTFTKERVRAARNKVYFNNQKIRDILAFSFDPVDEVIERVAGYYKRGSL